MRRSRHLPLLALALCVAGLAPTPAAAKPPSFDRAQMDTTCAPCRDFYRYANGGWLDRTQIPAAYGRYGSFTELADRNQEILHALLERAAANQKAAPGSVTRMLGDYYGTCMDSASAEVAGAKPMQPLLTAIDAIAGPADVARQIGWLHAHGVFRAGFALGAGPDARRSSLTIANAQQGGLGLPDRDYYTKTDSASIAMRGEYIAHVGRSLRLIGRANGIGEAQSVMAIESALAKASMTNVQRRDPNAVYHKMPWDSLAALTPGFDWASYLSTRGMRRPDSVNVQQPDFFRAFGALVLSTPLADWQSYLRWKVVEDASPTLSAAFVDEDFRFNRQLTGAREQLPRWKRCLRGVDMDLGDPLGRAYVDERFTPQARERALRMVRNLEAALGERIASLDWMTDATKAAAKVKLDAFANRIGYPDTWRDFGGAGIGRASTFANRLAARQWEMKRQTDRIGGPVEKGEWRMSTPTVNAFYSPLLNSINFPAGILQPPFYDPDWDDALNYGGIGAVIGHEMTHGFDDQGRQFDAQGNLRDWWTLEDAVRYKERATKVAEQFDGYTVLDSLHVNGRLTLGENIADLGGIAVAYAALQKALEGKPRPKIDGFTPEQRFFLSYARIWRGIDRPENLRTLILTNPHSPGVWRVNGPLSNLSQFSKAFGCKDGDPMVREASRRATIW